MNLLQNRLLKQSIWSLFVKVGAAGLSFLMFLFLANSMPAAEFGRFSLGFSLATFLSVVGSFGSRMLMIRFASIYRDNKDNALLRGLLRYGYGITLVGTIFVALCVFMFSFFGVEMKAQPYLYASAAFTVILALAELQVHVIRAVGNVLVALIPRDIIWRSLVILGALLSTWGVVPEFNATTALYVVIGALTATFAVQLFLDPITNPSFSLKGPIEMRMGQWISASAGLWSTSVIAVASQNLAVIIIGIVLGPTEAGSIFIALRIANLLDFILIATNNVTLPRISQLYAKGEIDKVQRLLFQVSLAAGGASVVGFSCYLIMGQNLIDLFGQTTPETWLALIIISIGFVIHASCGPNFAVMEITGNAKSSATIQFFVNLVGLIAMFFMAQLYGLVGVAVCIAGIAAVSNGLAVFALHKQSGLSTTFMLMHLAQRGRI